MIKYVFLVGSVFFIIFQSFWRIASLRGTQFWETQI